MHGATLPCLTLKFFMIHNGVDRTKEGQGGASLQSTHVWAPKREKYEVTPGFCPISLHIVLTRLYSHRISFLIYDFRLRLPSLTDFDRNHGEPSLAKLGFY